MNQTYLPNLCLTSYFYSLQSFCYQTSQEGDLIAKSPNHPLTISPIFHIYKRNRVTIRNSLTFLLQRPKGQILFDHFADSVRDRAKQMFTKDRKWILRKKARQKKLPLLFS